ncbi:TetR/AcrR family transcriptional regulator [Caryophanon tenue]|nr:TetR/AcrR family transcriptional regulator [Caryophanon tenue]
MKQERSIETRNKLLKAGTTVFLYNGFTQTTMTQIIKEAGVGYGTAYVYFKNKDDLLRVIMDDTIVSLQAIGLMPFVPSTKPEAIDIITKQLCLVIDAALQHQRMLKVVYEAIGCSPLIADFWKKFQDTFKLSIARDIRYVQEIGLAHPHINADVLAHLWYSLNEQVMWDFVLHKNNANHEMDEVVELMVHLYTNSLYK